MLARAGRPHAGTESALQQLDTEGLPGPRGSLWSLGTSTQSCSSSVAGIAGLRCAMASPCRADYRCQSQCVQPECLRQEVLADASELRNVPSFERSDMAWPTYSLYLTCPGSASWWRIDSPIFHVARATISHWRVPTIVVVVNTYIRITTTTIVGISKCPTAGVRQKKMPPVSPGGILRAECG